MANGRRRPIAPVRKIIAAVLGTLATFVILFGFGMGNNWPIVALGVALLTLAISIVAVTAIRGGARAWVVGIAHVHSVSEPPASSRFGRCELQIVIDAPGLPPRSVKVRDPRVPVNKWPAEGATLPVMVAIDDQRHVRILWDDVLTHTEARQEAAARAADGLPPQYTDPDPVTDDVLVGRQAPPWTQGDPDDDFLPPGEDLLAPPDPAATAADLSDDPIGPRDQPRQPPGKGVVLEGTLVEPPNADAPSVPLPRRPGPGPGPGPHDAHRKNQPPARGTADPHDAAAGRPDHSDTAGSHAAPAGPKVPTQPTAPRDTATSGPRGGPSGINGVGITVLVADLARSTAFYRDRLGFVEIDGGEGNAVLASGTTRLVLRSVPDVAPVNRRLVHLNLEVDDVHAVYERLKSNGVRFTYAPRAVNRGAKLEQWAAAFRDPDGHGVTLTQWRSR